MFFFALDVVTHFAPIGFYKQTALRTDAFTQSSFYAQIFLHREFCAQKKSVHRRLYTEVFTQRRKCFVQKCFFAHINQGTQAFLHRTFSTEKPLHRTVFTHVFLHKKTFDTEKLIHTDCTQKFLQTDFFLHA